MDNTIFFIFLQFFSFFQQSPFKDTKVISCYALETSKIKRDAMQIACNALKLCQAKLGVGSVLLISEKCALMLLIQNYKTYTLQQSQCRIV